MLFRCRAAARNLLASHPGAPGKVWRRESVKAITSASKICVDGANDESRRLFSNGSAARGLAGADTGDLLEMLHSGSGRGNRRMARGDVIEKKTWKKEKEITKKNKYKKKKKKAEKNYRHDEYMTKADGEDSQRVGMDFPRALPSVRPRSGVPSTWQQQRLESAILRELSVLFASGAFSVPGRQISILEAKTSRDMTAASVWWCFEDEAFANLDTSVPWTDVVSAEEVDSTNFDLRRGGKRISKLLSRNLNLRKMLRLEFLHDRTMKHAHDVEHRLRSASKEAE